MEVRAYMINEDASEHRDSAMKNSAVGTGGFCEEAE